MHLRTHALVLLLGLSTIGCVSRAGPFVTRIGNAGDGQLFVERCYVEYNDGARSISTEDCSSDTLTLARAPDPGAQARATARALSDVALAAAHNGDCGTVRALEPKVHTVDAQVYATVFAADASIRTCITSPPAAR